MRHVNIPMLANGMTIIKIEKVERSRGTRPWNLRGMFPDQNLREEKGSKSP